MKNLLLIITIFILLASACGPIDAPTDKEVARRDSLQKAFESTPLIWLNDHSYYQIITIDSCEYIMGRDNLGYNGGYFMSHKGDCKNPIHKQNVQHIIVYDTVKVYKLDDKPIKLK